VPVSILDLERLLPIRSIPKQPATIGPLFINPRPSYLEPHRSGFVAPAFFVQI
jgi:hypothetical protein